MSDIKPFKDPIYIVRPVLPQNNKVFEKINDIWGSKWLTNFGFQHKTLENKLKKYLKVDHLSLFCNGTIALDIALKALKIEGEVITTPFTFPATITCLYQNRIKPIFCDINLSDFNIDSNLIEDLITSKTSAILPVHVFGNPCEIEKNEKIAKKNNLKLIYDTAHCFGVEYKNKGIGNFGDINMFSFHATKIFHTIEGGALTYIDQELDEQFYLLKNFGIKNEEEVILPGTNGKMNELQAAIGLLTLQLVDKEIEKRKQLTMIYRENLKNVNGIKYLDEKKDVKYNYQYFSILINEKEFKLNRNQVYEKFKKYNVFSRKYFYPLSTDYKFFEYKNPIELTNAKIIANQILCLPLYGELTEEDINKICNILLSFK